MKTPGHGSVRADMCTSLCTLGGADEMGVYLALDIDESEVVAALDAPYRPVNGRPAKWVWLRSGVSFLWSPVPA